MSCDDNNVHIFSLLYCAIILLWQSEAEIDSTVRAINEEKARLQGRIQDFELERKKFLAEREKLEHERKSIDIEKEKLEQIALQVQQRSKDIEDMCMVGFFSETNHHLGDLHRKGTVSGEVTELYQRNIR